MNESTKLLFLQTQARNAALFDISVIDDRLIPFEEGSLQVRVEQSRRTHSGHTGFLMSEQGMLHGRNRRWFAWCDCGQLLSDAIMVRGKRKVWDALDVHLDRHDRAGSEARHPSGLTYIDPNEPAQAVGYAVVGGAKGGMIEMQVGTPVAGQSQLDRLLARKAALEVEIARLEALPTEPELVDEGEPHVIWFIKRFNDGGREYTYAAVRCPDDNLWYTTGPSSPKGYSWDRLIQWIMSGNEGGVVWWATEWSPL